jgi:hypothetical protein
LRRVANDQAVECRGLLWLFDQLHKASAATTQELYQGLAEISQHPRCRLPKTEISKRLELYAIQRGKT